MWGARGCFVENIQEKMNGYIQTSSWVTDRAVDQRFLQEIIYPRAVESLFLHDEYFNYEFGPLEYKSVTLDLQKKDTDNFQGNAVVNYTEQEIPYTRIIEHKHFEFGTTDSTWISYEYPTPYEAQKTEPYYPVNDATNNALFQKYKDKAAKSPNVIFGGRLAEYKYYDMHQIIERALDFLANH